ncbi:glycosyltransferase [Aquabacterium sp. A7-Y]|uniref:glycosyltransferase n=1 Tax=Aquabacterium sp. A7-Y TaxID=1349605 RepID=UPI00223E4E35|nr:glycosyltransferase [Aquabacterium sp. A7-Y]MCW7540117.1 glycosyltransferase [Aquabacterium sp. A7-Y]
MRILISAVGSHGDILPFIGLALALRERGHDVRLYGNGFFTDLVAGAGLTFVATSDARLYQDGLTDQRLTDSRSGLALVAQGVMSPVLPTYEAMARDVLPGQTLLVGSFFAFAPRLLAETQGLPFAAIHLAPSAFRSDHLAPRISPLGHFEHWPRVIKGAFWAWMDRRILDPLFGEPLNRLRSRLGLPPARRVLHRWIHHGSVTIGLFPEWLAPRQPDWPADLQLVGFPMYDGPRARGLSPDLDAFLDAGTPPVVFTAGTGNATSHPFYAESAQACERLGLRGLLVAQRREQLPEVLPPGVMHVAHAPFSQLFPRAAAVVHHGGIGTLSQALRAGVPQLIRPMAYDQFDNASRACRLGVARELLPRSYRGARLESALRDVANNPSIRAACESVAERMAQEDGLHSACAALERRIDSGLSASPVQDAASMPSEVTTMPTPSGP